MDELFKSKIKKVKLLKILYLLDQIGLMKKIINYYKWL